MDRDQRHEELILKLFVINAVKFGEFMTKSGIKTPVYFDLRVIVSYPDIMELISSLIYEFHLKDMKCNHLCGVPYTALPIATLLSVKAKIPMLMRRKETKSYGTKKLVEGHFTKGESCLIIEDVVTSGSSVLETVQDLRREGLIINEAIVILDREQGGYQNLQNNQIQIQSLFTMTTLISILLKNNKITEEMALKVQKYMKDTKTPVLEPTSRLFLTYEERAEMTSNLIAKQLFNIMVAKKTNLCVSVDMKDKVKILELLEKIGGDICLVKTHIDIIDNFDQGFIDQLKQLADTSNFLILEDRKFADIGNTVALQYTSGLYKISQWAHCVTVHSLPGEGVLQAFNDAMSDGNKGVFLLA